jgi:uncharacterized caspase-like protein
MGRMRLLFRLVAPALIAGAVAFISAGAGFAEEKRVALIVGNSKYRVGGTLRNPVEDAAAMQVALHRLGFQLIVGQDLALETFQEKVREFSLAMRNADIALLFYAGHGVQYKEQNYLLPTDIELNSEAEITAKSMRLNKILEDMGRQAKVSVILLDACRDAPQLRSISRGTATGGGKSIWEYVSGLATITEAAPADRFIAFAAAPGKLAEDGRGKNSPFTDALLRHIAKPDTDIGAVLNWVRRDVLKATSQRQQPETVNALTQPLYLNKTANASPLPVSNEEPSQQPADEQPPAVALSSDAEFWFGIKDTTDPKNFEDYLQQYPKGRFAMLAKRKVEALKPQAKAADPRPRLMPGDLASVDGEFVIATGIARITKSHPKAEALRSARALARAKIIVSKLPASGLTVPGFVDASSDAAELLAHMGRGLTYEEAWTSHQTNSKEVKFDLRAKVRLLPDEADRKLSGSIEPAEVVSGQPYRLKLAAKKDVTIGVFAWQANGTVVRLYPESVHKQVFIKAGEPVAFPRSTDGYPAIASSTMPGEKRNHEALIVVTGSGPIAFEQLVPATISETAQHSANDLLDGSEFLLRLAALQDAELEVLVLPYEIRSER